MEPTFKRALSHPKRLAIFEYFTQKRTAIAEAELVEALDLTAPVTRYHLTVLCDADLIAEVEGVDHRKTGCMYIAATPTDL